MYCTIFHRGKGRASGIDYLTGPINCREDGSVPRLGDKDYDEHIRRPPAEVLRGDMELTKSIIRESPYSKKYTSGVLSFNEQEIPRAELSEIMDSFEEMVTVGVGRDRVNFAWVMHRDKGRTELHFVIPNIDLETGKRFQPYYHQKDMPRFRAFERLTNYEHGFTDPSDPTLARSWRLSSDLPLGRKKEVMEVSRIIEGLVARGEINNHQDVLRTLQEANYVITRTGKNYIGIQNERGERARLKGAIFSQDFTDIGKLRETIRSREPDRDKDREQRLEELRADLDREIDKHCKYLESRSRGRDAGRDQLDEKTPGRDLEGPAGPAERDLDRNGQDPEIPDHDRPAPGLSYEHDPGRDTPDLGPDRDIGRDRPADHRAELVHEARDAELVDRGPGPERGEIPDRDGPGMGDMHSPGQKQALQKEIDHGRGNEGVVAERVRGALERGRNAIERVRGAADRVGAAVRGVGERITANKELMMDRIRNSREELDTLKKDVNLVEYAQDHGFQREAKGKDRSCTTSIRLVRGDEVILIGKGQDGHWLYHDMRGDRSGSIVDFAQHKTGRQMTLGEVRKELRQYQGLEPQRRTRTPVAPRVEKSSRDQVKLDAERATLKPLSPDHKYLAQERGISERTVKGFSKDLALDEKGRVCFPTYDKEGRYCGSDKRIPGRGDWKGFTPGGNRDGLWSSRVQGAQRVVITESAIDAMSYHELKGQQKTDYISLGGSQLTAQKKEQLKQELSKYKEVVIATDNDKAGIQVAREIRGMRTDAKLDQPRSKDWNQELQTKKTLEKLKERQGKVNSTLDALGKSTSTEKKLDNLEKEKGQERNAGGWKKDRDDGPGRDM